MLLVSKEALNDAALAAGFGPVAAGLLAGAGGGVAQARGAAGSTLLPFPPPPSRALRR